MLTFLNRKPRIIKSYDSKQLTKVLISLCKRFPSNLLYNQMLPVTVFELALLPSRRKILKILSLSNNRLVIKN